MNASDIVILVAFVGVLLFFGWAVYTDSDEVLDAAEDALVDDEVTRHP